jgi:serine phosphatase RsbU (regulator of sigma subunit)
MKFKLKIAHKLILAFGVIFLGFLTNSLLTLKIVNKNNELSEKYQKIYAPSAKYIDELSNLINDSKFLIKNWVWVERKDLDESTDKLKLVSIIDTLYPELKIQLDTLSHNWDEESQNFYNEAKNEITVLFDNDKIIMYDYLFDFASYEDPLTIVQAQMMVDPDFGEIMLSIDLILSKLAVVSEKQNQLVKISNEELTKSSNKLGTLILILTFVVGIVVILIGSITTSSIVKPMVYIKNILLEMAHGILPSKEIRESSDEVGQMAKALNVLIGSFRKTSEFAENVGRGNFNHYFKALSEHDILGNSLIVMRNQLREQIEQLKENEEQLEQKVIQRTKEVVAQKEEIEKKNKDITASINYAQRIQQAMLPQKKQIKETFDDAFIYFNPRDIVSGDFYWYSNVNNKVIITAIDCTGHGVPGAFMSLIGEAYLNQIIERQEITEPDVILNELHKYIRKALKQEEQENHDGMDMALCSVDMKARTLEFAGAKNPLVYIQNSELFVIKGDKHPIGGIQWEKDNERKFTKHLVDISKPTSFYIYSDGFGDQYGGESKRKFMGKKLNSLLLEIYNENCDDQESILSEIFNKWRGDNKQIDDVLIVGCKIK